LNAILKIIKSTVELKKYYIAIAILNVVVSLMMMIQPIFSGRVIALLTQLVSQKADVASGLIISFAVIFSIDIAVNIIGNYQGYLGDQMTVKLKGLLSNNYFHKLMHLRQSYFDDEKTGAVINRLTRSIDVITRFLQMMSNNFISFFLTAGFSIIYIAYYSWETALTAAILIPFYIWLTRKTSTKWIKFEMEKNQNHDIATGRFAEVIGQIKVTKSFLQEPTELQSFANKFKRIAKLNVPQSKMWHTQDVLRKLVITGFYALMYGFLIYQAYQGQITAGPLTTIILMLAGLRFPLMTMGFIVEQTQSAIAGSQDYFTVMDLENDKYESVTYKNHSMTKLKGDINFKDVDFAYDGEENKILKNLSFTIEEGQKVAFVAESGEGKSTITNLLLGFYRPQNGSISIGKTRLNDVDAPEIRNSIAVVFQDPSLFSGTIKENIAYGKIGASDDQIIAAAKKANAHGFIIKFNKGYDEVIGERGLKLSGGQKQRIAIARAILKDAPILVLDEATSSLDNRSESEVQAALDNLMEGRTTIIIAHRLSTIAGADRIITIAEGRVQEQGTPPELAKSGGIYNQLLDFSNKDKQVTKKALSKWGLEA
jgi:ATP-binding cassette subfamily B protein